jgi:hypothetical protein
MLAIKNFFLALLEGLQEARKHQAETYLSKAENHHDLEAREKALKRKGLL